MKARLANIIRTVLYKKRLDDISEKEKIELFDMIYMENLLMHESLNSYKLKRKFKAEIERLRKERGWKEKKHPKINLENDK